MAGHLWNARGARRAILGKLTHGRGKAAQIPESTASIGGRRRSWTAEITDQTPDVCVARKSTSSADNAGAVLFQPIDAGRTQVTLIREVDPERVGENGGDAIGAVDRQVKADLEPEVMIRPSPILNFRAAGGG